jgi:hypothetical protein
VNSTATGNRRTVLALDGTLALVGIIIIIIIILYSKNKNSEIPILPGSTPTLSTSHKVVKSQKL